jgi:hypothetical protein
MTHPDIYPLMGDDTRPKVDKFKAHFSDRVKHVLVRDNDELIGMFLLVMHSNIKWEAHTLMLPNGRGRRAVRAYREGLEWCKANGCRYLYGVIPEDNHGAIQIAVLGGMQKVGVMANSIMRGGLLIDEIIVGKVL